MPQSWNNHDGDGLPEGITPDSVVFIAFRENPDNHIGPLYAHNWSWNWTEIEPDLDDDDEPIEDTGTEWGTASDDLVRYALATPDEAAAYIEDHHIQDARLSAANYMTRLAAFHRALDTARGATATREGGVAAIAAARTRTGGVRERQPTRALTPEEITTRDALAPWAQKEFTRLATGHYAPPPWADEPWAKLPPTDPRFFHFAHISTQDAALLAYTPDAARGATETRVQIKPGRYLARFFGDVLGPEQIKAQAARVRGTSYTLHITNDAAAITRIYRTVGQACMSHAADHYQAAHYTKEHPTAAYTRGDLALAFARSPDGGDAVARAIVWPARKLYARCYGDTDAMQAALAAEGYRAAPLDGARIATKALTSYSPPGYYAAPYIDHCKWAALETDPDGTPWLRLQTHATGATHSVQHGNGVAYPVAAAPQRPASTTRETAAAEHARLLSLEANAPDPTTDEAPTAPTPEPEAQPQPLGLRQTPSRLFSNFGIVPTLSERLGRAMAPDANAPRPVPTPIERPARNE